MLCACVRRIMPPSDKLSPCLAFRELILGRGWASNLCRWVARPREPLSARLGSPSEHSGQGEEGVGRGKGSRLEVFGGDKIRGRKCSTCHSTWVIGGLFGKGRGDVKPPSPSRLPGTCHKDGLQPPHPSDGLTVGSGRNPGVDAGRLAGREAGSTQAL